MAPDLIMNSWKIHASLQKTAIFLGIIGSKMIEFYKKYGNKIK